MYSRSQISLGFSTCGDSRYRDTNKIRQVHMRDFEAPMSGAFYFVEYQEELKEFYELDREIVCYSSREELLEKVRFYLANPDSADASLVVIAPPAFIVKLSAPAPSVFVLIVIRLLPAPPTLAFNVTASVLDSVMGPPSFVASIALRSPRGIAACSACWRREGSAGRRRRRRQRRSSTTRCGSRQWFCRLNGCSWSAASPFCASCRCVSS